MIQTTRQDPSDRRRRAVLASVFILLLVSSGALNAAAGHELPLRSVEMVKIGALIFLALVLGLRSTTNFTLVKRNPALDDELTRANRASAALVGFWVLMLGAAGAFVAGMLTQVRLVEAAPLLLIFGAAGAGLRFAVLEARGVHE